MDSRYGVNADIYSETTTTSSFPATQSVSRSLHRERRVRAKAKPRGSCYHLRRLKSRGALQVLLWNLLVFSYQNTALYNILILFDLNEPWKIVIGTVFLQEVLPRLFYPVAGWIADAKVGRYKVIRTSLLLMWIGSLLLVFLSLLKYCVTYLPEDVHGTTSRYEIMFKVTLPFTILVYVLNAVGNAGFHANIIPFGLDQMEDGSAEQHSAFIHWYYWTRNVSFGTLVNLLIHSNGDYCNAAFGFDPNHVPTVSGREPLFRFSLGLLVFESAFLAAAISIDFVFSAKYLNKDPKTHYPLRRIWKITKFVRQHNHLVGRRKAITFTYDAPPDRWDFAKRLYGGPFDGEDVEDVRTFWRILVFICSMGLTGIILIYQGYFLYGPFVKHMKLPAILSQCISEYAVSNLSRNFTILLIIPIYEFVIYPLFRRYVLRILRRIGLGMVLALAGTVGLLLMDSLGHQQRGHCMLFSKDFHTGSTALDFTPGYLIPLIFLTSLGEIFIFVPTYEFICAQSPYSMRGLLIGLYYAIGAFFLTILGLILGVIVAIFSHGDNRENLLHDLSCGSWYLIISIGIGIIGFMIYITVAKWYKNRERDGRHINEQTVLEGYYEPRDNK